MKKADKTHLKNWPEIEAKGRKNYALNRAVIVSAGIVLLKFIDFSTFNISGTTNIYSSLLILMSFWMVLGFLTNYFILWPMEVNRYKTLVKEKP